MQISQERLYTATLRAYGRAAPDQKQYLLADNPRLSEKSSMASIKLRGWFTPKVAAHINRRQDSEYFIGPAGKAPIVNGRCITRPIIASSGRHY